MEIAYVGFQIEICVIPSKFDVVPDIAVPVDISLCNEFIKKPNIVLKIERGIYLIHSDPYNKDQDNLEQLYTNPILRKEITDQIVNKLFENLRENP